MSQNPVGCVPLTWNRFKRENPEAWPEARILREVKAAGFDAVVDSPKTDQSAAEFLPYLAGFGLKPAPGYMGGDFWESAKRDELTQTARRKAEVSKSIGLSELFVAPTGGAYVSRASGKTRLELAGQVGPGDGLTREEMAIMAETLDQMGRATLEFGVVICIHNHVAQVIETREEVDRLFELVDPEAVFLGPDIGHLEFAGVDSAQFCRDYAPRIQAIHLKDINPEVRAQGVREGWDRNRFVGAGIYTELGQGCVDWNSIFQTLRESGYEGWILSEIDVTQKPTALESATQCREFLKSHGF